MIVLLAHLTSESLELALVRKNSDPKKDIKPHVFLTRSLPLHADMRSYLKDAHERLASTKEAIDSAFCVLGSAFFKSETKRISKTFSVPTRIDENLLKKITATDEKGTEIENEILSSKANGYSVKTLIGKEVSDIEIVNYQSADTNDSLKELKENIIPISRDISFHTPPYIFLKILSGLHQDASPFLIINIERTVSNFSFINAELYIETVTVQSGISDIIRKVMVEFNSDEEVSLSLLKMMNEGSLDEKNKLAIEKVIQEGANSWASEMKQAFRQLGNGYALPSTMYLFAPQEWLNIFRNELKNNDYSSFTSYEGQAEMRISDLEDKASDVSFESAPEHRSVLLADVLFIDKYLI